MGLIRWSLTETGAYYIEFGKVVSFEKSSRIYAELSRKLVNAKKNINNEIGSFLHVNYNKITSGHLDIFPVDAVNLDFDSNISKRNISIADLISLIFDFQSRHRKDFAFFITFPETESEDEAEHKSLLKDTIEANIQDDRNLEFSKIFSSKYSSVDLIEYEILSIIAMAKIFIKFGSDKSYELSSADFFIYGDKKKSVGGRKRMISLLFRFKYKGRFVTSANIYYRTVNKCLDQIVILNR